MTRQVLGQVVFKDKAERQEIREFVRDHFGRTLSAQIRYMLLKAKREAQAVENGTREAA